MTQITLDPADLEDAINEYDFRHVGDIDSDTFANDDGHTITFIRGFLIPNAGGRHCFAISVNHAAAAIAFFASARTALTQREILGLMNDVVEERHESETIYYFKNHVLNEW